MDSRRRGPATATSSEAWDRLRAAAAGQAPRLCAPLPAGPGCCGVCRGPARPGYLFCFHCAVHRQCLPALLADLVVPVSYSIAGSAYARVLWEYKSEGAGQAAARALLRAVLLVFLHDHGRCLWARAGMVTPSHLAVVPSGRGRPGAHPLQTLAEPYLALPWADLAARPGVPAQAGDLRPGRFHAAGRLAGATVLLLDDTWTSGGSAQSAAAALKLAGARSVLSLILGRHVNPSDPAANSFSAALAGRDFRPGRCAVHDAAGGPADSGGAYFPR